MQNRKTDYRRGVRPSRRKKECEIVIISALRKGKKTFGSLLIETGLSRSTLAFHLKEMHRRGLVERKVDLKDYRITHYSLTSRGRGELRKQEDIGALESAESFLPSPETIAKLADTLVEFLEPSIRSYMLSLVEEDSELLKQCITYSIYADPPLKGEVGDYVTGLAELAATSMLSEIAVHRPRRAIKEIHRISLVFKFDKDKINEFLQKFKHEISEESLPRLPDIRDYRKKQLK